MRFEDGLDSEWGLVLREPVSAEETRALLDRLAVSEGGGEEGGTVGAVCEVSGVGPEVVGRMLADIRGVSWQELFGDRLDEVEKEVTGLRSKVRELERKVGDYGVLHRKPFAHEAIDRIDFNALLGDRDREVTSSFYNTRIQVIVVILMVTIVAFGVAIYWIRRV